MTESSWLQSLWQSSIYWREPLWLLLALQPIILLLIRRYSANKNLACYADPELHAWTGWQQSKDSRSWLHSIFTREALYFSAWLLLAISMAGPRLLLEQPAHSTDPDMNIMLVVDVSRSMQTRDIEPNRLHRAQIEINELLSRVTNKRVGLILYTARAHLFVPFTTDINVLKYYLQLLETIPLPTRGSSPASALELAQDEIEIAKFENKSVILWFTDGDFTNNDIATNNNDARKNLKGAVKRLASASTPLYILGLGSPEGDAIPITDGGWLLDKGRPVISRMNEKMLSELANMGNGRFINAQDDDSDWDYLYQQGISADIRLTKMAGSNNEAIWQELFTWTLFPAIILLFASLMPYRWSLLNAPPSLLLACLLFASLTPTDQASARDNSVGDQLELEQQAYHAFVSDDFSRSSEIYRQLTGYNARLGEGSCYYRMEKYPLAIAQFSQAVLLADTDLDRGSAIYNLANATFMAGDFMTASELFRDVLNYRPAHKSTIANLAISRSLQQLVAQQLEKETAYRMGSGPRMARAIEGLEINDQGSISFDNEEERKNVVIPLPDIPVKNLQEMLARGLDHARVAKGNQPGLAGISPASGYQLSQDINAAYIRMRELDDHQLFLWKRLFEMEEGFAASVEEAKTIPGIHPW